MKVTFILDGIGTSGGVRMVFNFANYLAEKDYDVTLLSLREARLANARQRRGNLLKLLQSLKHFIFIEKFGFAKIPFPHKLPIYFVNSLHSKNISDADIVIATACSTAFEVAKYPKNKGEKFYFIQDFETWSNSERRAIESWKLPLKKIVTSDYLARLVKQKTGKNPYAKVPCGIEPKFYQQRLSLRGARPRILRGQRRGNLSSNILMIYNSAERKGGDDGIKALKIVKKKFPNVKITLFGIDRKIKSFKSWAKIYYFPSQKKLINLYRQADIFVYPSRREGFGLPGLEALTGKCALVATDVGAVREYSQHKVSSLISPAKNPKALAKNIIYLLENPEKIRQFSEAGFKKAKEFKLKKAGKLFEKVLYQGRSLEYFKDRPF